ncbi:hypothetical protein DespoDRAFT_02075 [Desulfobacter postgatei 2ac9]|uniref:Uncharacterized protein n=1 Tax=Desulfobacter postgatei 2ac9 TaxID=879212 RepID=I5B3A7_9BACT|nr:hypothetical protein DespoDRAFT_02075 [Desulfobacter postgatei 2ac9]
MHTGPLTGMFRVSVLRAFLEIGTIFMKFRFDLLITKQDLSQLKPAYHCIQILSQPGQFTGTGKNLSAAVIHFIGSIADRGNIPCNLSSHNSKALCLPHRLLPPQWLR